MPEERQDGYRELSEPPQPDWLEQDEWELPAWGLFYAYRTSPLLCSPMATQTMAAAILEAVKMLPRDTDGYRIRMWIKHFLYLEHNEYPETANNAEYWQYLKQLRSACEE